MRTLQRAYINGNIYTVDSQFNKISAFGIAEDRFAVVGSDKEVLALCSPETEVIDLEGKTVLPGLIDAHLHVTNTGAMKVEVNVLGMQKQEILEKVKEAYKTAKPGEWIVGRGWINDEWIDDTSFPSKEELDAVAPDIPVYLKRNCGHAGWVNSKAFEVVGVNDDTPNPFGGEFMRKPDGTLLGVVSDQAQDLFNRAIPPYNREQIQRIALAAQDSFLPVGLTTVHDAGSPPEWVDAWSELYEQQKLKVRIYGSIRLWGRPTYDEMYHGSLKMFKQGTVIGKYDNRLTIRGFKISGDGSLGARSAWMLEDYSDCPGARGFGKWTDEQMYNVCYEAHRAGFQIWYHGIGDAANRQCLDVYERIMKEIPQKDPRHRIEHAQILSPEDLPRFKKLGVLPTHQTVFIRTDKRVADTYLGDRIQGAYAWRTLIDDGNVIPNGTDSPVESCNPFLSMYCAVTRMDEYGTPEGGWHMEEAMTREEALRSYTNWAAYAGFEEDIKGSIEIGKLADFVIIDRDFMVCPAVEIKDIQVLETVIGGEVVYKK